MGKLRIYMLKPLLLDIQVVFLNVPIIMIVLMNSFVGSETEIQRLSALSISAPSLSTPFS